MQLQKEPKKEPSKVTQRAKELWQSLQESLSALWGEKLLLTPIFGFSMTWVAAKQEYKQGVCLVIAIYVILWLLHVSSVAKKRAGEQRKRARLLFYLARGLSLRTKVRRCEELPTADVDKWCRNVEMHLRTNFGLEMMARLRLQSLPRRISSMQPTERQDLYRKVDKRVRFLSQIMSEQVWKH